MYSQQLKNGKYRFFESYLDPMTMIRKTTSVTMDKDTRQSRKMAQELLREKIRRFESLSTDVKRMSLDELLKAYKSGVKGQIREQTRLRNVRENEAMIELLGEKTQVDKLNIRYIVDKLSKSDWKSVTKNERIKRFKSFMRWGYRMGYVKSVEYLSGLPHYEDNKKARRENKYLEPDELKALVESITIPVNRQMVQFMAMTGMRVGEVISLKTGDVDVDNRVIHIVSTYSAITHQDGPTKTDGSMRDIYIQDELLELIKEVDKGKTYFFEKDGKQVDYYGFNKYLREKSEKVLKRPITTHYLRHTHTSILAQNKVDLESISKRLGHSDSRVTREIYMHITEAMKQEEKEKLNGVKFL